MYLLRKWRPKPLYGRFSNGSAVFLFLLKLNYLSFLTKFKINQHCTHFKNRVSRRFDFLVSMWRMHYLPSAHFHTAMLCAASMSTVTRSLPLQLKFTAHTPLVWNPCMTDKVSLDVASHTWTQGSVPIWPVATMFCQTQHNLNQYVKSKTDSNLAKSLFTIFTSLA